MCKMLFATVLACSPIFAQACLAQAEQAKDPASRSSEQAALPDGAWSVLCAEIDGRKLESTDIPTVTISNNTLTFRHDGKEYTMRLELQPQGRLRATDVVLGQSASLGEDAERKTAENEQELTGQNQKQGEAASKGGDKGNFDGVFIQTNDFLCVSLKNPREGTSEEPVGDQEQPYGKNSARNRGQGDGAQADKAQDKMTLILRRAYYSTEPASGKKVPR
jgi:hypothetical protein